MARKFADLYVHIECQSLSATVLGLREGRDRQNTPLIVMTVVIRSSDDMYAWIDGVL